MKKDLFYKWHSNELQKHTTEVDVDALWSSIESDVDAINVKNKKKRRFFFFFSFLGLGILSAGFIGFLYFNQTPTTQHIIPTAHITTNDKKEGTQIANIETDSKLEQEVSSTSITAASVATEKYTAVDKTLPPNISSLSLNLKNDGITEKIWKPIKSTSTPEVHLSKATNDTAPEPKSSIIFTKTTSESLSHLSSTDYTEQVAPVVNSVEIERAARSVVDALPYPESFELTPDAEGLPSLKVETKKASPFQFSVSAYFGLAYANRNLEAKDETESSELLFLRENTERSLELWNNGVKAKISHKSGFNFSLGIQYSRLAENLVYDAELLDLDSTSNQVIGFSNNLLGDQSEIIGFAPNNTLFDLEYDFYNYHHFIDVPISIGYQKQFGLWNFGVRTGIVYNLYLQSNGRILEDPFTVANVGDSTESPFVQRSALSYEGGISAFYRLGRHIEIGLEAYHRYAPSSITIDSYQLRQNYSWTGLNASINYLF